MVNNNKTRVCDNRENAIEWYSGQDMITVSLTQKKYIRKLNKIKKKYPEKVKIIKVNPDGSVYAKLPIKALHIFYSERELSEEEKEKLKKRLGNRRKNKKI